MAAVVGPGGDLVEQNLAVRQKEHLDAAVGAYGDTKLGRDRILENPRSLGRVDAGQTDRLVIVGPRPPTSLTMDVLLIIVSPENARSIQARNRPLSHGPGGGRDLLRDIGGGLGDVADVVLVHCLNERVGNDGAITGPSGGEVGE